MSVEKRHSKRQPVEFQVYLRYRQRRAFAAMARDLAPDGMSLSTGALTIPTGTLVELEFSFGGRSRQLRALVAHARAGYLGLMFWEPQPELCRVAAHAQTELPASHQNRFELAPQAEL